MKRESALVIVLVLISVALAAAQGPPQPGPELKKLDYFAGTWRLEGDLKPSPFGPGGKFTGTENNEWGLGGFFLMSHSEFKMPMGGGTGLAVFGYKADEKVYVYHAFNSMGEAEDSKGMLEGDTWSWTSESKMEGKVMKGRFVIKVISPTSYSFKFDMQPEGGEWATVMDGKATKEK
jgi:hypothetical protein